MKAILVIDMPTECIECPFHRIYADDGWQNETHCSLLNMRNKDGVNTRAEWCPLKPMPQKQNNDKEKSWREYFQTRGASYQYGHIDGWNDCLEEIENG